MGIGMGREGPMSVKRSSLPTRAGPLGQEKYFFEKTVDTFSTCGILIEVQKCAKQKGE